MSIRKRCLKKKKITFFVFFIFDIPRIQQNLRDHAIGMFNAGMMLNAVAMNIGRFTCAIRHR